MKSWKEETWRGRVKMVVFALTPMTVLLLLWDGLAAVAINRSLSVVPDARGGRTYEFRMGRFPWSHVSRTPLNSMGFPDIEFEGLPPKDGCTHVVFVGDSYTFGDGVDTAKSYVSLIRARVGDKVPDRCLRIFNIGQRATTIDRQTENLDKTWPLLQPDVVILSQYQNDLSDLTKPWQVTDEVATESAGASASDRRWLPFDIPVPLVGVSINRWLTYQMVALLSTRGIHYDVLARWSILADPDSQALASRLSRQYRDLYAEFIGKVRGRGAEVAVVILPSKFDVLAGRSPEDTFFRELAREHQVPALSLFEAFNNHRRPYPYLMYDGHLNERGNEIVANALMDWLFDPQRRVSDLLPDGSPPISH